MMSYFYRIFNFNGFLGFDKVRKTVLTLIRVFWLYGTGYIKGILSDEIK